MKQIHTFKIWFVCGFLPSCCGKTEMLVWAWKYKAPYIQSSRWFSLPCLRVVKKHVLKHAFEMKIWFLLNENILTCALNFWLFGVLVCFLRVFFVFFFFRLLSVWFPCILLLRISINCYFFMKPPLWRK